MRTTILSTLAIVLCAPLALPAQGDDFSQVRKFYGSQIDAEDRFGRSIDIAPVLQEAARYGSPMRRREAAIKALGKLARGDQ